MSELINQITHITKEIEEIYGEDYSKQYFNASIILVGKLNNDYNEYEVVVDTLKNLVDNEYKQKQINDLQKNIKDLEKEVKNLKEVNKQKDIRLTNLEKDNINLNKKVNILMKNHYNLVLWQAYKNLEYYIIQKVTNYDDNKMDSINTNLNEFIKDLDNSKYIEDLNNLIVKFKIDKYKNNLGKLTKNRLREAHLNPIELDELELACDEMKSIYNGIEEFYNNYQEVYNYFN
jgi:hypothetical protein